MSFDATEAMEVTPCPRPSYVEGPDGPLHIVQCGEGDPVLLIHQTPRSCDEYRELLPILGARYRAIAMDLPGMGGSAPSRVPSIEQYAASALAVLDALGVQHCDVVGHHTGGVVALELAASQPERVRRLVLSSTPWVDRSARLRRRDRPAVDEVEPSGDGSHLVKLWQQRQVFYPPDRPDLLERFVTDALRATDVAAGHRAVGRYEMERRVELVVAPTLCIGHEDDMFAFPDHHELLSRIAGATSQTIAGGMVPLEWRAAEVAEAVMAFLGAGD